GIGGPLAVTVTSTGSVPVTVTDVSDPRADFRHTGGTCGAPPFPLSRLDSCTLEFTFQPYVEGPAATPVPLAATDPDGTHPAPPRSRRRPSGGRPGTAARAEATSRTTSP